LRKAVAGNERLVELCKNTVDSFVQVMTDLKSQVPVSVSRNVAKLKQDFPDKYGDFLDLLKIALTSPEPDYRDVAVELTRIWIRDTENTEGRDNLQSRIAVDPDDPEQFHKSIVTGFKKTGATKRLLACIPKEAVDDLFLDACMETLRADWLEVNLQTEEAA